MRAESRTGLFGSAVRPAASSPVSAPRREWTPGRSPGPPRCCCRPDRRTRPLWHRRPGRGAGGRRAGRGWLWRARPLGRRRNRSRGSRVALCGSSSGGVGLARPCRRVGSHGIAGESRGLRRCTAGGSPCSRGFRYRERPRTVRPRHATVQRFCVSSAQNGLWRIRRLTRPAPARPTGLRSLPGRRSRA